MFKILLFVFFFSIMPAAQAQTPLPAEKAFALSAYLNPDQQLVIEWQIAPGYYLYRDKIELLPAATNAPKIQKIAMPHGENKRDAIHGAYQIYTNQLSIPITFKAPPLGLFGLKIIYQGCSKEGFCYPPVKKNLQVDFSDLKSYKDLTPYIEMEALNKPLASKDYATTVLAGHHAFLIMLTFLFLGLLLAFTPCVLPMIPILSSIIVDQGGKLGTKRAFLLSLAYVLGMALAYAGAGIIVALMGSRVQIILQQPWVIALFSGLFVLLALSLFGLYDIQLSNKFHQRLIKYSEKHRGGTYVGVFMMGVLSSLIISPCVSAPLVGALAYIGNSGNIFLGAIALFSLGIGMGIPLLLVGLSAGKLLPKTGPWMDRIKQLFGFLMLGLAIWMLARILPPLVIMILWGVYTIGLAIFLWQLKHSKIMWQRLNQGMGLIFLSYALILLVGAGRGQTDLFYFLHDKIVNHKSDFLVVNTMAQLEQQLQLAKTANTPVVLDFYADWCSSCVLMDKYLFSRGDVKDALAHFVLLRVDITHNTAFDKTLLQKFNVIAPPTILFFDGKGKQLIENQIVGEVKAKDFVANVAAVSSQAKQFCENNPRAC